MKVECINESFINAFSQSMMLTSTIGTTVQPKCCGHSTSINACGVWGAKAEIQVSKRDIHTHVHLD